MPDEALIRGLQGLGGQVDVSEFGGLVVARIEIGPVRNTTVESTAPVRKALKTLQPSWALSTARGVS